MPFRRLVGLTLLACLAAALLGVLWLGFVWPPPAWWNGHWPARTAFMTMRAGQLRAAHDTAAFRYEPVPFEAMAPWLKVGALVAEDDGFYQHHGVDWHALRGVLGYRRAEFRWSDARDRAELRRALRGAAARRDQLRGASTITQQLAKNLYLSPSRNPLRKLKEMVIAYRLEWALPKDRILALYLNVAEFGANVWGVEAGSRRYFNRAARTLSMDQAALLVATLPHPLTSNPALRPGRTRFRAQLIVRRLRGESVEVPREADAEEPAPGAAPGVVPDSVQIDIPLPQKDTAAAPVKPDTTAAPPPKPPGR